MGVAQNFLLRDFLRPPEASLPAEACNCWRAMAATWRDGIPPSIETELWRPIHVHLEGEEGGGCRTGGGEKRWLVKSIVNEDSYYHVLVTDLCSVWGERLGREGVSTRSKVGSRKEQKLRWVESTSNNCGRGSIFLPFSSSILPSYSNSPSSHPGIEPKC